jgi:hypothetical protein
MAREATSRLWKQRGGNFKDSYWWDKRWNPNHSPSEISDNDPRNRIATIERVSVLGAILQNGADDLPLPIHSVKFSLPEA